MVTRKKKKKTDLVSQTKNDSTGQHQNPIHFLKNRDRQRTSDSDPFDDLRIPTTTLATSVGGKSIFFKKKPREALTGKKKSRFSFEKVSRYVVDLCSPTHSDETPLQSVWNRQNREDHSHDKLRRYCSSALDLYKLLTTPSLVTSEKKISRDAVTNFPFLLWKTRPQSGIHPNGEASVA